MGRRRGSSTGVSTTTTTTVARIEHAHSTDVKLPLKAFKLWCLKRCSRASAVAASPTSHGSEAVATGVIESQKQPAWMRDGSLDPTIWRNLPDEIHEHILAFLPFPTLFRCATVCKQWRNIAHGTHLRLTRAAPTTAAPWPAYCPVRYTQTETGALHWSGFSLATNKWQPLPQLPLPSSPGKSIITGSGGLLVVYKPNSIFVCNPVTGQRRELPPTNQKWLRPDILHMIVNELTASYKIILAGTEAYSASKPQPTEVYDSATNTWTITGSLPTDLYLDTQDAALENGLLYCTAQKAYMQTGDTLVGTDALVAYDVARGVWSEVASHLPDESARQTPLVCGGKMIMAVAPVDDDGPVGCFYALNAASRRWELLASMPEELHRRVRSWGVCSVVAGQHIVVVSDTAQGCVVAYDVNRRTWSELRSPIKFGKSSKVISNKDVRSLAPISFCPDMNASP
ncbi:hypothetical protein KC19_2G079400 [Ceratodon purpureus]|uniref:F-box domain-containing protein n=2 Tax=Ceratodon purpureus TaxID=3225 RepID=A0A8T0IRB8_CERPU|nr:hypothetical protein KC19_2G079400 [Ceratodon purpureus]